MKKIVVSGGFDPVHKGHLELFENAKKLGGHLTIILNTDSFLKEKKGYVFMTFKERKKILLGFECVDKVIKCIDKDNTVCETLIQMKSKNQVDIFANGGDRKKITDIPEHKICKENGIKMVFDIGGEKFNLVLNLLISLITTKEKRPWGYFENLLEEDEYKVKKLTILPNEKISHQFHNHRIEKWHIVRGSGKFFLDEDEHSCEKGVLF